MLVSTRTVNQCNDAVTLNNPRIYNLNFPFIKPHSSKPGSQEIEQQWPLNKFRVGLLVLESFRVCTYLLFLCGGVLICKSSQASVEVIRDLV